MVHFGGQIDQSAYVCHYKTYTKHSYIYSKTFTAIFCGNPGTPANGSTTVTSDTVGSIAEHFCDEGFNLVGADRRECLINGSWSDQLPTCVSK